jgi:signal transduction histidine kinase
VTLGRSREGREALCCRFTMVGMVGLVLAVAALAEMVGRLVFQPNEAVRLGVESGAHGPINVPGLLLLCLLSAAAPLVLALAVARPGLADWTALIGAAACVVSLEVFGLLTVASAVALAGCGYLLGRRASAVLIAVVGAPFLILTLLGRGGVIAVLVAFFVPVAGVAGLAWQVRGSASLLGAVKAASAGSLAEHLARGERARIARELHDVVAHHISMIAVQAETGRLTTPGLPAAGAKRFEEIAGTARAGLTEMRRLLGVLREDAAREDAVREDAAGAGAARAGAARAGAVSGDLVAGDFVVEARNPQPGLAELNALVDAARDASSGLVRLIISGPFGELDPGVELAVYRIVQEALSNARRHAPGAAVDVELHFEVDSLRVWVRDNGPGDAAVISPDGHGLLGMRERAQSVGGSLQAGPMAGGGFLVEARVPVPVPVWAGGR